MCRAIIRIMLVTFTLMLPMVGTVRAEGTPAATLSVSCTIPEVPGLNAPLKEAVSSIQPAQETTDKTIVAAGEEGNNSPSAQDNLLTEDSGNYNTILKTAYRK